MPVDMAGQVHFGFAGKGLWQVLDRLRTDPARKGFVPVKLGLMAEVKFFGGTRPASSAMA